MIYLLNRHKKSEIVTLHFIKNAFILNQRAKLKHEIYDSIDVELRGVVINVKKC